MQNSKPVGNQERNYFGLHVYHNESNEICESAICKIINSTPKFPGIQRGYCKISNIARKKDVFISEGCL